MEEPPRKRRATVAFNYCRQRKRKCDGRQPVCTLCEEANQSQCEYQERQTKQTPMEGDQATEIIERLKRLEQAVTELSGPKTSSHDYLPRPICSPLTGSNTGRTHNVQPVQRLTSRATATSPSELNWSTPDVPYCAPSTDADDNAVMSIPLAHSTTTGDLLRSGIAQSLLGAYPADVFKRIEVRRQVPASISFDPVPRDQIHFPVIAHLVNPQHPVLVSSMFMPLYCEVLECGPGPNAHSTLVLLVLALGAAASETPDPILGEWLPGVQFFTPALKYLMTAWPGFFSSDNTTLTQALYLAAVYYSYLSRPAQAWHLVYIASANAQHLLIQDRHSQYIIRLCWAIFMLECDITAEHHLPRSSIELMVETLPFPECKVPPDFDMFSWLANLSAHRLLNRIHHLLYGGKDVSSQPGQVSDVRNEPSTAIFRISQELHHQLLEWYNLLPSVIRPNLDDSSPSVEKAILLLRYHAAGDIIFRPFLLHVLQLPQQAVVPEEMLENARMCLRHCRGYLLAVEHRLRESSGSLEIVLHSTLAAVLLLTQAFLCPKLASAVQDITSLQSHVISLFKEWAFPGSSIEAMLSIVRTMRDKFTMLK
ncbi:hypothetical protein K469DRAFT_726771 [Zopfia rhizophila CBS 207.26]|uniref:Zn(2)-C6 fungal-type domain-containing protein n=1 Tax=Zopfia rhizophila CBS 207.26 TaxID=1314779 RepID=A0A6A6E4U4_9PEZI|nr:hypothetical protein K469DRAFT_726771 [Zopfia rhizophila CBS 207.26]